MICSSSPCVRYSVSACSRKCSCAGLRYVMSSAGCGSGTRFLFELMTNNRLLSLYDCSVHLMSFGSADIDPLTCRTASCRPHPYACFSWNGRIGVLLSELARPPYLVADAVSTTVIPGTLLTWALFCGALRHSINSYIACRCRVCP